MDEAKLMGSSGVSDSLPLRDWEEPLAEPEPEPVVDEKEKRRQDRVSQRDKRREQPWTERYLGPINGSDNA